MYLKDVTTEPDGNNPASLKGVIMSEWKTLDIGNLPSDILVGDYEFVDEVYNELRYNDDHSEVNKRLVMLKNLGKAYKYFYRKVQPKVPSHSDVAFEYIRDRSLIVYGVVRMTKEDVDIWMRKAFIDGRLSMESDE